MVMYLVGGYFSKYPVTIKKPYKCMVACLGFTLLNFIYKYLAEFVTAKLFGAPSHGDLFMSYTSPIIVGEAISIFLYFCNLKIGSKKLVKAVGFITPTIFSVYIIHVHPLVFWRIFNKAFTWLTEYNLLVSFLLIIAIALAIFIGCIALDYIRILIFKLFKVDYCCVSFSGFIKQKTDKLRGLLWE